MQDSQESTDVAFGRAQKVPFCMRCGLMGHKEQDCPTRSKTFGDTSSTTISEGDSLLSTESNRSTSDDASYAESTYSASSFKTAREKSGMKPVKSVSHDVLEGLYKTRQDESRNPVGENFRSYNDDVVSVSDESFNKCKINNFGDCLHNDILKVIRKLGYVSPLPVQRYAISIINSGRNLKASARTGCGKTAAFLLPVINKILNGDIRVRPGLLPQSPKALIISPTRELAQQIHDDASKFAAFTDVKIRLCHGRASYGSEILRIKEGTNILIGTPGRTLDHLEQGTFVLDDLRYLIFDEADRLMEPDFAEAFDGLMDHIKNAGCKPQTLMFSATFPERLTSKMDSLLADHVSLKVGIMGSVNDDIRQQVLLVPESEKKERLLSILKNESSPEEKSIIFVRTKQRADMLKEHLFRNEIRACILHGDRDQYDRTKHLKDFNDGRRNVLVATLLANRGLDINLVNHVINYDLPGQIEQYVNCLGRTGRVGNSGRATSFFDPRHRDDIEIAPQLRLKLKEAGEKLIPDFLSLE